MLPAVIALIAENAGHVKAVAAMTKRDLDPVLGRAIFADGVGTVLATSVGGSPTTTYAENIGVMAATRVYSTAAYYVAAIVAILLGLCPKFGALVNAIPGGVLGGITVILYGMIGLLGAKIWKENRVDFANPINLVPLAAGIIIGIGNVNLVFSDEFSLGGIALGSIVAVAGWHAGPRPGAGGDEGSAARRGRASPAAPGRPSGSTGGHRRRPRRGGPLRRRPATTARADRTHPDRPGSPTGSRAAAVVPLSAAEQHLVHDVVQVGVRVVADQRRRCRRPRR